MLRAWFWIQAMPYPCLVKTAEIPLLDLPLSIRANRFVPIRAIFFPAIPAKMPPLKSNESQLATRSIWITAGMNTTEH